jgi:hypothetical protein
MLTTSLVIGQLVEDYFRAAAEGKRDCRLLVPGLTRKIAQQVHAFLLDRDINTYLVIGEEEQPSEPSV